MLRPLPRPSYNTAQSSNTEKIVIDCSSRITKDRPTTEAWLEIVDKLKETNFRDANRVLLGVLEKQRKRVVIKLGESATLKKEYDVGQALRGVQGFIEYICFFTCTDDYKEHDGSGRRQHLCKGPGTQMSCLVMPYYPRGGMTNFDFNGKKELLTAVIKESFDALVTAFERAGFVHNDFHGLNIMLAFSGGTLHPVIMDFENAFLVRPEHRGQRRFIFQDFERLIADLTYNSPHFKLENDVPLIAALRKHAAENTPFEIAMPGIRTAIDRLEVVRRPQIPQSFTYNPNVF